MPSSEAADLGDYRANFFREKKWGDKRLLVTTTGSFDFLTEDEYELLISHRLNKELYERFKNNFLIVTEDNKNEIIDTYRRKKNHLFRGTTLHIVVPTLRCNEKCVYCHALSRPISSEGFDMDSETARKTVDYIFQSPSDYITIEFQGGEPLVAFERVKEITLYALEKNKQAKKNLNFSIVSNLSLLDEEKLDFLVKHKVGLCTSLDGPKWLHDKNRPMPGGSSYDKVVYWIEELKRRKIDINALLSVTRHSLPYAKEIADEYNRLGINSIWYRMLNPLGCASNSWKAIGFTPEEFLKFWKEGVDYVYKKTNMMEGQSSIMLTKMLTRNDPGMLDLMSPCGAAIGQTAYNYDGDIYTCDEARMIKDEMFKIGNVHKDTYREVMTSNKVCHVIEASVNDCFFCDTCIYQPYCGLCPVATYANTSTLVPNLPDHRCKILMGQFEHMFELLLDPEMSERMKKRLFRNEKKEG